MAIVANTTDSNVLAKVQTGVERLPVAIYKLDALVDPTADDDRADGYSVNSIWMTTSGTWICKDDSPGAAVWALMSSPPSTPVAPSTPEVSSSGINYIVSGDAEIDTTGWSTYDDVTSIIDGVGGSPSVTWTNAETANPLRKTRSFVFTKGASNLDNEGVSYDFTIDQADRGRTLGISFDYRLLSGTFWDDDIQIWIYDITNAQLIQPSVYKLTGMNTVVAGYFQSNFQAASNSISYRLILHNKNATATAYAVLFDNIRVSPDVTSLITPITDWVEYTPIVTASSSNPVLATSHELRGFWRRVGGNIEIRVKYVANDLSGATIGSGTYYVSMPPNITPDFDKMWWTSYPNVVNVGIGSIGRYGYAQMTVSPVIYQAFPTKFQFWYDVAGSAGDQTFGSGSTLTFDITNELIFSAAFPVLGWGSTVQISTIDATRPVLAKVVMSVTQSGVSSEAVVKWDTIKKDTHGIYNPSTGIFTFPLAGDYSYSGHAYGSGTGSADTMSYHHMRGATEIATAYLFYYQAGNVNPFCGKIINVQAGDTLYVTGSMQTGTVSGNLPTQIYNEFSLQKDADPRPTAIDSSVTPISNWQSYTPSAQAISLSTGVARWRRVGSNAEIEWSVAITGNGTGSQVRLYLPPGMSADTNIPNPLFVGMLASNQTINYNQNGLFAQPGANYLTAGIMGSSNNWIAAFQSGTDGIYNGAGLSHISFCVSVPIAGWASNINITAIDGARPVVATVGRTSDLSLSSGNYVDLIHNSKLTDTHNAYNTSTGIFTVPTAGVYHISGTVRVSGGTGTTTIFAVLKKNGTEYAYLFDVEGNNFFMGAIANTVQCNEGDTLQISIRSDFSGGAAVVTGDAGSTSNKITFSKVDTGAITLTPPPNHEKTYQTDVAYTNGTPTVTMNAPNPVKTYGYLIPYQTSDGQWWVRGYVMYAHDLQASVTLSISGMVCIGAGNVVPCSAYYQDGASSYVANTGNTGVFDILVVHPLAYSPFSASFDVPITGKPTWAD